MSRIDQRPPAIFLMGPTAAGKTQLACALSDSFDLDLVSVDSALVYRGMDIGTAKPDVATLRRHPHRLIDIRAIGEPYSAAEFRVDALREMAAISARGRVPLLVGGTGLYFRALERGLSDLPGADAALREKLAEEGERMGWALLHARLRDLDPASAKRIDIGDAQRIQRALEVITLSGRALSGQQGSLRKRLPYRLLKLGLLPADRSPLHARIEARFDAMLAAGFVDELHALRAQVEIDEGLPAARAVGYRQGWLHLDGRATLDEFRERTIFATRQLAKRQITWLRSERDARLFDPDAMDMEMAVKSAVEAFLGR